MTDLTPAPPPKRPSNKKKPSIKAYCPPELKKRQDKQIEDLDLSSAMLTLDQLTCIIAGAEFGVETAAMRLGWPVEKVEAELRKPECAFTLKMARDMILTDIVRNKVKAIRKLTADKATFAERLLELAYMDPSQTKGSIDGQVKAVKTLIEFYGKDEDPLKGKNTDELQDIVRQGHAILEASNKPVPVQ